jgi:Domain of unknown function (DUF4926)
MLLKMAELCVSHEGWPAGTKGAIVEAFEDGVLLEVVGEDGETLAMLPLRYDVLVIENGAASAEAPSPHPAP